MTRSPMTQLHIVDQLIEERAVRLSANPWLWPWIKRVAYPALGYRRACAMADTLEPLAGRAAMDWAQTYLDMQVTVSGLEAVPETGACVLVANHPGGITDGVAVWQALKVRRPDMVFFANRDAIRVCPGLADTVIPVEWREGERSRDKTRETLRQSVAAFREGRCVVVFPAGRMSVWDWRVRALRDPEWASTAVSLARKFNAPTLPMGVRQRMSLWFYGLGLIHEELRHMTVFHELLAKQGASYRLAIGEAMTAEALGPEDAPATAQLKGQAEALARSA